MLTAHIQSCYIKAHFVPNTYTKESRWSQTHLTISQTFHLLAQTLWNSWKWMRHKKRIGAIRGTTLAIHTHPCKLYECNNDLLASHQKASYNITEWGDCFFFCNKRLGTAYPYIRGAGKGRFYCFYRVRQGDSIPTGIITSLLSASSRSSSPSSSPLPSIHPFHPPPSPRPAISSESSTLSIWRKQVVDAMLPRVPAVHCPHTKSHDLFHDQIEVFYWPKETTLFCRVSVFQMRINDVFSVTVGFGF